MSPILDMQVRFRELGRIRIGQQVASNNGKRRPTKLETFRITSPSETIIRAAAKAFGGEVRPWTSPAGKQWEVVTTADTLDVAVLPDQALTQWNEMWSGGGCTRRCDGETEMLSDQACLCPSDPAARRELAKNGAACKPTTRLSVMLTHPDLPDVGIYRLEAHGWYAATELMGAMHLARMSGESVMDARLRLEQRETKRPGQPTMQYGVPVLELRGLSVGALLAPGTTPPAVGDGVRHEVPARVNRRERVARPALPPGPPPPSDTAFTHGEPVTSGPSAPPPIPLSTPPTPEPESRAVTADGEIVDEMSADDLRAWLSEHFISRSMAAKHIRETFGDDQDIDSLAPAQRAQVRAAMTEQVK